MGRTIDADNFKKQIAAMTIKHDLPVEKANAMIKLIDMQPTAINGKVTDAKHAYQRITYVYPTVHHYEEPGETPYIKYGCPICETVGNQHRIAKGETTCPLCNANLSWENQSNK